MTATSVQLIQIEPPIREAYEVSVGNLQEICTWLGGYQADVHMKFDGTKNEVTFRTPGASTPTTVGDWLVLDDGLIRVIKAADFEKNYKIILAK